MLSLGHSAKGSEHTETIHCLLGVRAPREFSEKAWSMGWGWLGPLEAPPGRGELGGAGSQGVTRGGGWS